MTPCLLIAGPTAAGKTALSLHAAHRLDGEIINADSMQIYAGLPLITAQPDAEERSRVPHHLFGVWDAGFRGSVGDWTRTALEEIGAVRARGRTPILVGGTGMYFKALTQGLAPVPEIDEASREKAETLLATGGAQALRAEAERFDPASTARIAAADQQRLQRIVEVGYATGRALSDFHVETAPLLPANDWFGIILDPERDALYARIEQRFDHMVEQGALAEAQAYAERGLDPALPASKALGLPPLMSHLAGEMQLEQAIELAKRDSRRYAKRQMTWFRNQHADWPRLRALEPAAACRELDAILAEADLI